MAALRDCASWLKYGGAAEGNPAPGALRHAYAYGRSQTGRLLRTMVHHDLNVDETGRRALDGIIANVAGAMLGEFNDRFGQNSKDRPDMMDHFVPFQVEPRGGLKVFYTNTSFEYHRGDASLIHTDPAGARDVEHGPDVRVYHFTGTEHGTGIWPAADAQAVAADPRGWLERAQHLRGVVNYGRLLRAALVNLDRWLTEGVLPPPSRHPRVGDGTAVDPAELAPAFARIPAARYPGHNVRARRQDFSTLPPRPGAAYGARVSARSSTSPAPRCPSRARGQTARPPAIRARPSPSATPRARSTSNGWALRPARSRRSATSSTKTSRARSRSPRGCGTRGLRRRDRHARDTSSFLEA